MTEPLVTLESRAGSSGKANVLSEALGAAKLHIKTGRSSASTTADAGDEINFMVESVIGEDERILVRPTTAAPWQMICHLSLISDGARAVGTGFFVGPRTILTAGHCLHHMPFFGGFADRIIVSPGRDGDAHQFGQFEGSNFRVLDKWIDFGDPDFDFGCLTLEEPIGEQTGWFGLAAVDPADLPGRFVNISGYPGDLGGTEQYHHAGHIRAVSERRIHYDVDTAGGQSGSPVFVSEEDCSGQSYTALGVHAYGSGGSQLNIGVESNSAPMLLPETFAQIGEWIEEDN